MPQAKTLIPSLRPDLVVIDVDETDIWDDFYRYRKLTVRDDNGSIIAVRPSPTAIPFFKGLVESTDHLFYIHRLIAKLYFTRVEFPRLQAKLNRGGSVDNLSLAKPSEAELRRDHAAEIAYFKTTLEDLTNTVVSLMGEPNALIYIHHPHLEHLEAIGGVFNNVVAETLRQVADSRNVRFYDATNDLKATFGNDPAKYYFPNDMHFNPVGTSMYGKAVAKFLASEPTRH